MKVPTKLSPVETEMLQSEQNTIYFKSNYSFLRNHNGFRPEKMHVFMGVSGGGKSTLVRSLIIDILSCRPRKKILLWLTEETVLQFMTQFSSSGFSDYEEEHLIIISEVDYRLEKKGRNENHVKEGMRRLAEDLSILHNVDIFIMDNLTTARGYDQRIPLEQSDYIHQLKVTMNHWHIPFLIVVHAGGKVNENYQGLLSMNDIAGTKNIVQTAEYFYIMQTFFHDGGRFNTLTITKHRDQALQGSKFYQLVYAAKHGIYAQSKEINFNEFKAAYKKRNKL